MVTMVSEVGEETIGQVVGVIPGTDTTVDGEEDLTDDGGTVRKKMIGMTRKLEKRNVLR